MAKFKKTFEVRRDDGSKGIVYIYNQYGRPTDKNIRIDGIGKPLFDAVLPQHCVPATDLEETFKKIDSLNCNIEYFRTLLDKDFIYPGIVRKYKENGAARPKDEGGGYYVHHYEDHNARPLLEALFFERNDLFLQLVNRLIDKNDSRFYRVFLDILKDTDLSENMLFTLNKPQIQNCIDIAENHGKELIKFNTPIAIEKGRFLKKLSTRLSEKLSDEFIDPTTDVDEKVEMYYHQPSPDNQQLKNKFQTLQFKLDLVGLLHKNHNDSIAALRRTSCGYNPKRTSDNLWGYRTSRAMNAISLLLLGLPFLINRAATGHWFFFSRTNTERQISHIQAATHFPGRGLRFR